MTADEENKPMKTKTIVLVAAGCFLLLVSIVVIYMWDNGFSVTTTGTLGDGFNGLLAPFISAAAAVLVYLSFKAQTNANKQQFEAYKDQAKAYDKQVEALEEQRKANAQQVEALNEQRKANELISNQWLLNTYLQMLDDIKRDFDKIEVELGSEKENLQGVAAVRTLGKIPWNSIYKLEDAVNQLSIILAQILFLTGKLKQTPIERLEFIWHKLHLWYDLNLLPHLPAIKKQAEAIQKENEHQFFIGRIDKVKKEIYDFQVKSEAMKPVNTFK